MSETQARWHAPAALFAFFGWFMLFALTIDFGYDIAYWIAQTLLPVEVEHGSPIVNAYYFAVVAFPFWGPLMFIWYWDQIGKRVVSDDSAENGEETDQ